MAIHGILKQYLDEELVPTVIKDSLEIWSQKKQYVVVKCSLLNADEMAKFLTLLIAPNRVIRLYKGVSRSSAEKIVDDIAKSLLPKIKKKLFPILDDGSLDVELVVRYKNKNAVGEKTIISRNLKESALTKKSKKIPDQAFDNFTILFFSLFGTIQVQREATGELEAITRRELLDFIDDLTRNDKKLDFEIGDSLNKKSYRVFEKLKKKVLDFDKDDRHSIWVYSIPPLKRGIEAFLHETDKATAERNTMGNKGKSNKERQK